jgi:tetratricopeptide (TPR) repeat protein
MSVTREHLASAAEGIASRLLPDPARRAERLGEIFLLCEEVARERPQAASHALGTGELESLLLGPVRERLRGDGATSLGGGWLGTYVDESGRAIESDEPDATDREALELSKRALARALSLAAAENNQTLLRNLRWYRERLTHKSYEAIATSEDKVAATVRTGVARARKFVLRVVHELQHAQPAPLSGEAPPEVEPLRQLWFAQDLDGLARELERTRSENRDNPHWLNLAGLLAADRGRRADAVQLYERGLVYADAPSVRGRVLNNLGNLLDDHDCRSEAQQYWLRAHQILPVAPAPLLNLLGSASDDQDYASAQHYIAELAELLNSGRLTQAERRYVSRRLAENPKLTWLRETDAWAQGPARWIRTERRTENTLRPAAFATLGALLLGIALLWPTTATAAAHPSQPLRLAVADADEATLVAKRIRRTRGGDSMGKPRKRAEEPALFAGDSMGIKRPGPTGRRPRRPSS